MKRVQCSEPVKSRVPSIWFVWKNCDFLVAQEQKLGARALLEHTPMGENKSWSEASQLNGWERRKRGGALRPVMQPNEILLSCSDWSNVLALTDSQYWCQISLHLVASGDSLLACSPVTLGIISSTPSLFHFAEGHTGWWDKGSRTFLSLK